VGLCEAGRAVGQRAGDGRQGRRVRRRRRVASEPGDARTIRPRRPRTLRRRSHARGSGLMDLEDLVGDQLPANQPYDGLVAEAYDVWLSPNKDYGDVGLYQHFIEKGAGPALELGCGNGRLLVKYLAAGLDVEGTDASADMLAICATNARAIGCEATLHCADWLTLDLGKQYATVYNPARSFSLVPAHDAALH